MKVTAGPLQGLVIIEPRVFEDKRGHFFESYNERAFAESAAPVRFVQDNQSYSARGVLRGLHYQIEHPQGKLIRVIRGAIFDVAVDIRRQSPTFGQVFTLRLTAENRLQLYIPPGFAHGFCAEADDTEIIYKCTDFYHPQHERTLRWNDAQLNIAWPVKDPILSEKDAQGLPLAETPVFENLGA